MKDRQKIPDLPDCTHITNYCIPYGDKQNVKYVMKQPNNNESIDILLSKIENDYCKMSNLVYWRMSLIISVIISVFFWIFNKLENTNLGYHTYFFIFVITWFFNYWMRNYLDFHYHNHTCLRIKESVTQLKQKINNQNNNQQITK